MDEINWNVAKTETTKLGRFETIFETIDLNDGNKGYFSYVKFAKNGICILPILSNGNILMIEQYRRPYDCWLYEVPAGTLNQNEIPIVAAKRELLEETGYAANDIIPFGKFYPSPGSTTEQIYLFASHCTLQGEAQLDSTEHIGKLIFTKEQIVELLAENKVYHAGAIILLQGYLMGKFDG